MPFPDPAFLPTRHLVPWAPEACRSCDAILAPGSRPGFDSRVLAEAGELIRSGGLVVFPTETVYGLGADARNAEAVDSIFLAKGRPSDNPLIVHVHSLEAAEACTTGMNRLSAALAGLYWPGPLTLVLPRSSLIHPRTTAGMDTVGVRLPGSVLARAFLEACACPVAAPSANRSGRPSPTTFDMAWEEMEGRAAAIMEGPDASLGLESAILYAPDEATLHLLRAGSMDPLGILADLARLGWQDIAMWYQGKKLSPEDRGEPGKVKGDTGKRGAVKNLAGNPAPDKLPAAPGTRYRHYSPHCRVVLWSAPGELESARAAHQGSKAGIIGPPGPDSAGHSGPETSGIAGPDSGGQYGAETSGIAGSASAGQYGAETATNVGPETGGHYGADPDGSLVYCWQAADLADYARGLYRCFREADLAGCEVLFAWLPPGDGEWKTALRDRLLRASGEGHQGH